MKKRGGRFIGAAVGYTFGGPIGALLGAAIGYAVDEDGAIAEGGSPPGGATAKESPAGLSGEPAGEIAYVRTLVFFLVGAARADGLVVPEKIEIIRDFFRNQLGYGGAQYALVARFIDESLRAAADLPRVCDAIARRTIYEERLYLVQLAYRVSVADGTLAEAEEAYIGRAARLLGLSERDLGAIAGPFLRFRTGAAGGGGAGAAGSFGGSGPGGLSDPYGVLGIPPSSSDEEVRKAYRVLAGKYHPDKVLHLGREFIDLANRKFTLISLAYEAIKRERGLA